ncbi:MAG TPA: DUF5916 domain-containing protein [Cyclobacteriaceae bacterium]|nr:DUF5916 domain-containing protein [Cyclobacteriaceae bacterium]
MRCHPRPTLTVLLSFFLCGATLISLAQAPAKNAPGMKLSIRKATGPITLDGKLDEPDWQNAQPAKDFFLNYPVDTAHAPFQTEARVTFDDHQFYVSFVCYDDGTKDVVQSLRRDFDFDTSDNMGVFLGPYNDAINGFYFIVTPLGVQLEGTIASGGADGDGSYNETWDNKWYSKVTRYPDKWIAELAIPFKSFRYKSDVDEWNITFLRYDLKRNMTSSWIATPIQFIPASFAYSGKLVWEDKPPHHTTNISLIPFVAGGASQDKTADPPKDSELQAGLDAKIGITPSLNLDLTVNPDFSQVEVDRQVINLTRFEFQFPERRQFFLENNDLFERMGFPEARTFFSRRIGLARDTSGALVRVPILYGARLSGSLSKNWRVSMLNMQTKAKESIGLPGQNFTVAAIQRNFWAQSNVQFSFVNKESLGVEEGDSIKYFNPDLWQKKWNGRDTIRSLNKYNRVLAVDVESRSKDNTWYSSLYYSHSFDDFNVSKNQTGGGWLTYTKRAVNLSVGGSLIQQNFNAEVGFVPTKGVYPGIVNYYLMGQGFFWPKGKKVVNHGPGINAQVSTLPTGLMTDQLANLSYQINFLNTSSVQVMYNYIFQRLTNSFNPINDEFIKYRTGEEFGWNNITAFYISDQRKVFRYNLQTTFGEFYNGSNANVNGEVNYRYQPYGALSVRFDYNDIRLPGLYGKEKQFIVSPRMDLTFTDKLFLTTFLQYNTRADNVNLNARFQWRYKPASDFFVVYTENYLPQTFASKSRALVFKFTYWLNI